jgi:hypothetical protein
MGGGCGIRDQGSGKNLSRIPNPGVKKAFDPGSGIRDRYDTIKEFKRVGTALKVQYNTYVNGNRAPVQVITN